MLLFFISKSRSYRGFPRISRVQDGDVNKHYSDQNKMKNTIIVKSYNKIPYYVMQNNNERQKLKKQLKCIDMR